MGFLMLPRREYLVYLLEHNKIIILSVCGFSESFEVWDETGVIEGPTESYQIEGEFMILGHL